eukprot:441838-Prorocentrum_minimum.AAC.1
MGPSSLCSQCTKALTDSLTHPHVDATIVLKGSFLYPVIRNTRMRSSCGRRCRYQYSCTAGFQGFNVVCGARAGGHTRRSGRGGAPSKPFPPCPAAAGASDGLAS